MLQVRAGACHQRHPWDVPRAGAHVAQHVWEGYWSWGGTVLSALGRVTCNHVLALYLLPATHLYLTLSAALCSPPGEPVADKEGTALEGKALDKAKKDLDKARKVREPLSKALEKDPAALDKLRAEVEELQQQLAALEVAK
jgi:hypothetical protein